MGTTKLTWIKKVQDGYLFREDFENRYFNTNDQWQTLQGAPETTDSYSVLGTFSLDMANSNDNNGRPVIIKKPLNPSIIYTKDWIVTVWFYDTMDTTNEGPFFKVATSDGKFYQVGVRNSVSTTKYSVNQNSTTTEDNFKASSKNRVLGWRQYQVHLNLSGQTVDLYIDGTIVQSIAYTGIGNLSYVCIQGGILGDVTDSFGYFDELRVQNSMYAQFYGMSGRSIAFGTSSAIPITTEPYNFNPGIQPAKNLFDIEVSKLTDTSSLDLYWLGQEYNGGDVYYFNSIDFGRKAYPVNFNPFNIGNRNQSVSGRTQTVTTGFLNKLSFTLQILEGEQWKQNETLVFEWLRNGNPVSVQIDSDDACFARIGTNYPSAGLSSFNLNYVLGGNPTEFVPGNYYIIERADRTDRQTIQASGMSGAVLSFTPTLGTDFATNDVVRSVSFFPMMILDPNTSQMVYQDARYHRYNWPFTMTEYVP